MNEKFIVTSDSGTASKLTNLGFQIVSSQNGIYTFMNTGRLQFSGDIDKSKIKYSNILAF